MGINSLLPKILPSAGRENYDLRALSDGIISLTAGVTAPYSGAAPSDDGASDAGNAEERLSKRQRTQPLSPHSSTKQTWTKRKIRIAVDVNGWIARAAHGHGAHLMDERLLSYHGRAELSRLREVQRANQMQQQQQQQQQISSGEEHQNGEANNGESTNDTNNNEEEQKQLEYISKCIFFVLQRIEYLRDQCNALVLPVLDGATPPVKRRVVKMRSDKRKRAVEERDGEGGVGIGDATATTTMTNEQQLEEGDADEQLQEATTTEANALRKIALSQRAGLGSDYNTRRLLLSSLLTEFRTRQWPFIVAPYEADGQLAYLANGGLVDLVVTEDSDLIALGVPRLVYRLGGWNGGNSANRSSSSGLKGTILQRRDLGSSHGIDLMDFSDGMLATMFVATGCDYCDSLKGVGINTARGIVKRAFHGGESLENRSPVLDEPVLKLVLHDLYRACHKDARVELLPLSDPEKEEARLVYERAFLAALAMFRHPLVYDPISGENIISNDVSEGRSSNVSASFMRDEQLLMEYAPYRELVTNREALYQVVGTPFSPSTAKRIAEGLVDPRKQLEEQHRLNEEGEAAANAVEGWQVGKEGGGEDADNAQLQQEEPGEEEGDDDEEDSEDSAYLTQGTATGALQLSSQDFTAVGTQQSKSSGGNISSLSPDLLDSQSPAKQS